MLRRCYGTHHRRRLIVYIYISHNATQIYMVENIAFSNSRQQLSLDYRMAANKIYKSYSGIKRKSYKSYMSMQFPSNKSQQLEHIRPVGCADMSQCSRFLGANLDSSTSNLTQILYFMYKMATCKPFSSITDNNNYYYYYECKN